LYPVQVSDAYGRQDAIALYQFLLGRGYLLPDPAADSALPALPSPLPALKRGATPLTGVDMIKVTIITSPTFLAQIPS
jgi:hypothetical protein